MRKIRDLSGRGAAGDRSIGEGIGGRNGCLACILLKVVKDGLDNGGDFDAGDDLKRKEKKWASLE